MTGWLAQEEHRDGTSEASSTSAPEYGPSQNYEVHSVETGASASYELSITVWADTDAHEQGFTTLLIPQEGTKAYSLYLIQGMDDLNWSHMDHTAQWQHEYCDLFTLWQPAWLGNTTMAQALAPFLEKRKESQRPTIQKDVTTQDFRTPEGSNYEEGESKKAAKGQGLWHK